MKTTQQLEIFVLKASLDFELTIDLYYWPIMIYSMLLPLIIGRSIFLSLIAYFTMLPIILTNLDS